MTTFIQRCIGDCGDESDGAQLNPEHIRSVFALIVLGTPGIVATAKTQWGLSVSQQAEFDEVVATKPSGVIESAAWAQRVMAMVYLGFAAWPGFDSPNACRVSIGLAEI